jgi:hypothetical protein
MLRLLLKIWPALIPITIYILWVLVIDKILIKKILRRKDYIEGEKIVGEKTTEAPEKKMFSLQNRNFVITLYATFILAILTLIFSALSK